MPTNTRAIAILVCSLIALTGVSAANAQTGDYPNRPVKVIVPYGPGGVDTQMRALGPSLGALLGQSVIVENRDGAGATVGTAAVKSAPADGYTLLFTGTASVTVVPHLRKVAYTMDDFEPIAGVTATPLLVTVNSGVPYKTLAELIAYAKSNPGRINMGTAGNGTSTHIIGEAFQAAAGIRFTHVPFRGVGDATNNMLTGAVDLVVGLPGVMLPHFPTGKLRALASTGRKRSEFAPDVPSLIEAGLDVVDETRFGILAPRGLPDAVSKRIVEAARQAVTDNAYVMLMRKTFATQSYLPPTDFRAALEAEDVYWGKLLADPRFAPLHQQ